LVTRCPNIFFLALRYVCTFDGATIKTSLCSRVILPLSQLTIYTLYLACRPGRQRSASRKSTVHSLQPFSIGALSLSPLFNCSRFLLPCTSWDLAISLGGLVMRRQFAYPAAAQRPRHLTEIEIKKGLARSRRLA